MTTGYRVQVNAADLGGCGHYRIIWPAEAIALHTDPDELEVTIVTEDDAASVFEVKVDKAATFANGGTPVLGELEQYPDADLVILQRPLTGNLVHVLEQLQARGIAVAVEVDDDFETIHPNNIAWPTVQPHLEQHNGGRSYLHLRRACELADHVIVSTPALAARYGKHGRVSVVRNYVPRSYLHLMPPEREPGDTALRVGWSGSVNTHPDDLQVTRGAVGEVLRKHELNMHVVGVGDARVVHNLGLGPGAKLAHTGGWLPLEQYPAGMAMLDVGIVPLNLTPFNEAKSYLKGLEWAATGVPFIASPTGEYRHLEQLGAGLIADKPKHWRRHLEALIVDEDYRDELAQAGKRAAARLIIEEHLDEHLAAWSRALEHRAQRKATA